MEVRGQIRRILYHNEESNFYVFTFDDSKGMSRKAKGNFSLDAPYVGMDATFTGEWENGKYGETFGVMGLKQGGLDSTEGIEKYLMNYVSEIGPITARRLVEHFGVDTLDVLTNHPERLDEVARVTQIQKDKIREEWAKQSSYRETAIHLLDLDIPDAAVKRIYDKWGTSAIEKIQENPYVLTSIRGIGFLSADKVAITLGMPPDSPFRIGACLEFTLQDASAGPGHLFLDPPQLVDSVAKIINKGGMTAFGRVLDTQDLKAALRHMKEKGSVVTSKGKIYLKDLFQYETDSARILAGLVGEHANRLHDDIEHFISDYETSHNIQFSPEQRKGIEMLGSHKVLLITGLPGTGKTSLMKAIVHLLKHKRMEVQLMSPTGIAAKRLSSVVGIPASTIHRALGYKGEGEEWLYNEFNHLIVDAVVVDESSMIDQQLMYRLISALHEDTILVLVGDYAQLPSVGPGNVLHDLIRSKQIAQVNLTQIFRQEEASDIILNSHRINAGKDPILGDIENPKTDFQFLPFTSESQIVEEILRVVGEIQRRGDRDVTFQVLSPKWKGPLGVTNLNNRIREILNPLENQREVSLKNGIVLREGDRVMITANDYEKEVYNGEMATVTEINSKDSEIIVRIRDEGGPSKMVPIPYGEAATLLTLSFCITIHKSQGQEYDYVIFPFVKSFSIQLQKNLLYTAVTRAKKKVFILGEWASVQKAVKNNEVSQRNTLFAERIIECMPAGE